MHVAGDHPFTAPVLRRYRQFITHKCASGQLAYAPPANAVADQTAIAAVLKGLIDGARRQPLVEGRQLSPFALIRVAGAGELDGYGDLLVRLGLRTSWTHTARGAECHTFLDVMNLCWAPLVIQYYDRTQREDPNWEYIIQLRPTTLADPFWIELKQLATRLDYIICIECDNNRTLLDDSKLFGKLVSMDFTHIGHRTFMWAAPDPNSSGMCVGS